MQQGSIAHLRQLSPSTQRTDSGRLPQAGAKMDALGQHTDMNHKQACIDLEKATQYITQALQHEVGRNQELCMLIRRLEETEAETGRSLTEQVESNKQLKLKIDELYKHLGEKDHSLAQANQTVASLKIQLRGLNQHRQSQQSNSSPLQSDQLTAAEEPLVWSLQLESPDVHIPPVTLDGQFPLMSSDGQIPLISSDGQIPLVSSDGQIPLVSGIKEENAHGFEQCNQYETTETFLRTAINDVLPDLPEESKDVLKETLQSLGVEADGDLQLIEEADLLPSLRPIQARRLVAVWKQKCQALECSGSSLEASSGRLPSLPFSSPRSSTSTSSSSCGSGSAGTDWANNAFPVPWEKFPEELTQALETDTRPSPQMRREMVRIVVREMMAKTPCVTKRNVTDVGKAMVAKYPKSLQDVFEGDVIGSGYHSLVKQLQNRIENAKRYTAPKIRKRRCHAGECDTDEAPPEKRAVLQDTYGCINWDPKLLPLGETDDSQQRNKEKLKTLSLQTDPNPDEVKRLMRSTFYSQRKQVNQGKDIRHLLEEWPFWFDEIGMSVHFTELTGADLKETFIRNVEMKGKRLLNYLRTVGVKKSKFLPALMKFRLMRGELTGCTEDAKELVLLLLSYFDEKEDLMFCYVEESCQAEELQMTQVPLTPTIVVCGQNCFSSSRFMLSVDRTIVNDNISCFTSALSLMFGSYFCFNIHYPAKLASTLEFVQRCFYSVNPQKGTKVAKTNTSHQMNPRVLTLIQDLSDQDWLHV
ncbi:uncharacterized protein LOC134081549 isoform X2 [Sardina pilchardus]|uniref:uncharacterized protein LOC134081549 isoform X2 n=1 Tax=Sardina pilchardus TaxID=27697 RepID=UPI002E137121